MPRYSAEEGLHLGTAQGRKSWDLLHNFLLKKTFSNCITTITSEIDYVDTAIITSIKQYTGLAGNFFLNTIFCQKHGTPTGRIVNFLRKSKQLGHQQHKQIQNGQQIMHININNNNNHNKTYG